MRSRAQQFGATEMTLADVRLLACQSTPFGRLNVNVGPEGRKKGRKKKWIQKTGRAKDKVTAGLQQIPGKKKRSARGMMDHSFRPTFIPETLYVL